MKFIVDAQLPGRIAAWLREEGHDAVHTLDLPEANRTTDAAIIELAERDGRVVVTKDADFVNSHLLLHRPRKLLLVSTGNIRNRDLENLFVPNISAFVTMLEVSDFVELTRSTLRLH
jgi:predicted nuclease of predicted toxin-antitoxin system